MQPEVKNGEENPAKKMKIDAKQVVLRWAKLTDKAFEPVRGSVRAAGLDLRSAYNVVVPARGKALVKTDLQVQLPQGSYGRIAPRSGLAVKNFIDVGAGVVDEDYRGNLGVVLFNHADTEFEVKRGDRIAQFICERIFYPELQQVEKLDDTERGEGGFGSTGVKEMPHKNGSTTKDKASVEIKDGPQQQKASAVGVETTTDVKQSPEKKPSAITEGAVGEKKAGVEEPAAAAPVAV